MDGIWPQQVGSKALITATVATTLLTLSFLRYVLYPVRLQVIPSPQKTLLSRKSQDERKALIYPPDHFPGARDVDTPYGTIRVYEFGPETGRKVLFLHGISTSCMTLTLVANILSRPPHNCRVMLFDLFGRGYSDGVGDLPYDARLYVSQALCVLASSPLAWTGSGKGQGCTVVGYSLGGGIAVHLAAAFPEMVKSLVLLAPAGMIRGSNFGMLSMLLFRSGLVPESVLEVLTRQRLKQPIGASAKKRKPAAAKGEGAVSATTSAATSSTPGEKIVDAAISEAADPVVIGSASDTKTTHPTPLQHKVWQFVNWQVTHHLGFIPAFMSTVRHAPMLDQGETWKKLARRPAMTTCITFGQGDELVNEEDYQQDALPLIGGREHVDWNVLPGGHDFPMVSAEATVDIMTRFWAKSAE